MVMEITWIFCHYEKKTTQAIDGKCDSCNRTLLDIFSLAKEEKSKPELFSEKHNDKMNLIRERIAKEGKKPKIKKSPLNFEELKKRAEENLKKRAQEEKKEEKK